mmetsp:Transcript_33960/g.60012  ORF Transcript_33960/g.60012 Transcript_33960/m.60012 type:complete len:201 (-) Transcript_33960:2113-2715(-)
MAAAAQTCPSTPRASRHGLCNAVQALPQAAARQPSAVEGATSCTPSSREVELPDGRRPSSNPCSVCTPPWNPLGSTRWRASKPAFPTCLARCPKSYGSPQPVAVARERHKSPQPAPPQRWQVACNSSCRSLIVVSISPPNRSKPPPWPCCHSQRQECPPWPALECNWPLRIVLEDCPRGPLQVSLQDQAPLPCPPAQVFD